MKVRLIALAIASLLICGGAICFTGCSKDGSENIIGEWQRVALYWTYSGSPNASNNYSSGGPMHELDGASDMKFVFNEDKTGMMIEEWFVSPDENGIDTMWFTYSIDGDRGVITPVSSGKDATWTTTLTIQDIEEQSMIVYIKIIGENYQDYSGITTPYTRVIEERNHCKKIK